MNRLLELIFENRGYTPEYINDINNPDYGLLLDIDVLSVYLKELKDNNEQIVILPDFDMDGIMSGVVGFAGLAELGFNVALFIPDPNDGYGFTAETIDRLVCEYPDVSAILTCDVGITCDGGVKAAKDKGLTVLITDHHVEDPKSDVRQLANCVVNPMRLDETYAHPAICGAHVLWQCLDYYVKLYGDSYQYEQVQRLRVFAGIGTIADLMPVLYENRQLVRDSVDICRLVHADGEHRFINHLTGSQAYQNAFRGLYEAIEVYHAAGRVRQPQDIDESFFGYYLAPMFNSVKRLGEDLDVAFGVFFSDDPIGKACDLYSLNEQRKTLVAQHFETLMATDNLFAPYVYESDAEAGILGLLATKVEKITKRPVLVLRSEKNVYKGSGRAPVWYPALTRLRGAGFYAAGHEGAFGVGVTDRHELNALYAFLKQDVEDCIAGLSEEVLTETPYDYVLGLTGVGDVPFDIPMFYDYVSEVDKLRPFGRGFTEPVGVFKFSPNDGLWSVMGSTKQHVKITLKHGFEILCWNQAELVNGLKKQDEVIVVGKLGCSDFAGRRSLNFIGDFQVEIS